MREFWALRERGIDEQSELGGRCWIFASAMHPLVAPRLQVLPFRAISLFRSVIATCGAGLSAMSASLTVGAGLLALPISLFLYAYLAYPGLLWIIGKVSSVSRQPTQAPGDGSSPTTWPDISICLPARNEAKTIAATLDRLLALDYPSDRRQIVVVSDASSDGTDAIVENYANAGVDLIRCPERQGKTAAEAAAIPRLRGEIVVNVDATVQIPPDALKPLIRAFRDPSVGVASGRDVSISSTGPEENHPESGYVDYEMRVRKLETRAGSIVGASGCFYAVRRTLHRADFPEDLSRDFASCLIARRAGFRAVSVDDAVCFVPRSRTIQSEFRRKIRTMERGLATLWYLRSLMNPLKYGRFAWMLISHKLVRWLVWLAWPGVPLGLGLLSLSWPSLWPVAALTPLMLAVGLFGWLNADTGDVERTGITTSIGYGVAVAVAGFAAWMRMWAGKGSAIWEPTRRG